MSRKGRDTASYKNLVLPEGLQVRVLYQDRLLTNNIKLKYSKGQSTMSSKDLSDEEIRLRCLEFTFKKMMCNSNKEDKPIQLKELLLEADFVYKYVKGILSLT